MTNNNPQKAWDENEEQILGPDIPDTEVNPGEIATETEVDLDTEKIQTYPNTEPQRH